jgi:hypothetical protein
VILRLVPAHGDRLDPAVRSVDELLIVRRTDGCFVLVPEEQASRFVRDLAYAGIEADTVQTDLAPAPGTIPATAGDLRPARVGSVVSDSVRIRKVDLGSATADILRRRFAFVRAPSAEAQRKCRRLLRDEDLMFGWQRQAFIERGAVRSVRRTSSIRPVIFDRPTDRWPGRERRAFASDGLLARWAFG